MLAILDERTASASEIARIMRVELSSSGKLAQCCFAR
jgi:hypothetical protein